MTTSLRYESDGISLHRADSRRFLERRVAPASVDLVLTDPPYGISYKGSGRGGTGGTIAGDKDLNSLRDVMPLLDRVLRRDRHAYIFAAPQRLGEALDIVTDYWNVKNVVVWDKGNQGTRGDLTAGYAWNWEAIIYASKGRRPLSRPRPRCVFRYDWSAKRDPVHPTVKPVTLLSWLIANSTAAGELVLDPFAGSGTTLRAAQQLGRRAIGVELDERHCASAVRRLQAPRDEAPPTRT